MCEHNLNRDCSACRLAGAVAAANRLMPTAKEAADRICVAMRPPQRKTEPMKLKKRAATMADTTYLAPVPTYRIPLSVADMDAIETALKTAAVISEENGHHPQASDFRVIRFRFEANRSIQTSKEEIR